MNRQPQLLYEFGRFRLNPAEHQLLRAGRPVPLTAKVFDILHLLVQNSGHLLEKDELIRHVWPDTFVEEGNLNRHISTLRKILDDGLNDQQFIETVPKRGYRFVARVREIAHWGRDSAQRRATLMTLIKKSRRSLKRSGVEKAK